LKNLITEKTLVLVIPKKVLDNYLNSFSVKKRDFRGPNTLS